MHFVSIQQTLSRDQLNIVVAADPEQRSYVALFGLEPQEGPVRFVQVDRLTLHELQAGAIDVYTVMAERCAGLSFEAAAVQPAR